MVKALDGTTLYTYFRRLVFHEKPRICSITFARRLLAALQALQVQETNLRAG